MDTHQHWAELLRAAAEPKSGSDPATLLRRAVELGREVAPDAVACSITTIDGDRYHTPVSSDDLALELDRAQYESGDGPCMAAARQHRNHQFDAQTDRDRFPGFTEAAVERGVRSSISLPLTGPDLPSAINIYGCSRYAFDAERPQAVAHLLARCVSALMAPPERADQATAVPVSASQIGAAQERAQLIAEAEEALMASRSLSRSDAMTLLIRRSRAQRRSIFDVARDVIQAAGAGAARTIGELELEAYVLGLLVPDDFQHNLIAQALNEYFIDVGQDHPVGYRDTAVAE